LATSNLASQTIEDCSLTVISDWQAITKADTAYAKDLDVIFSFTENPHEESKNGRYTILNSLSILEQNQIR
jgi:hypothetical protein